jgi:HlyD family secretion protein
MKMKKKIIIISIMTVFLGVGFLFKACVAPGQKGTFQLDRIKRGDLEDIVTSTGTLSAVQTVEVGSQVSGILAQVLADYNDEVQKGQVLAVLDKTLFQVAVRDAEAGVFRAQAKLAQADAELKRNQPLFEKGHLSEMEFLTIKTAAGTAKADLETAKAALNRAQTNLDYTVIRSPINGTVIERTVEPGQTIAASFQAPKLFVIAEDLTRMQIEADVDESDIGQIKTDQSVRFEVQSYPDKKFTGKVRQIRLQPATIQNVVNYTVVMDAANENKMLLPGMTATVDFLVQEKHGVLLAPNRALSFKPTAELLKEYGPQMMEKMKSSTPGPIGGSSGHIGGVGQIMGSGMMTTPGRDNIGQVFYLDENGIPTVTMIEKGATDGKMTEILKVRDLKEGQEVITAYKVAKSSSSQSQRSSLLPPPGGGH